VRPPRRLTLADVKSNPRQWFVVHLDETPAARRIDVQITRVFMCQLPFVLNLPSGRYEVCTPESPMPLEVLNGLVALHFNQDSFTVCPDDQLAVLVPDYQRYYRQPLRTVMRHVLTVDVPDHELPVVGEAELLEDIGADVVKELMGAAGGQEAITAEARRRLDAMPSEERELRRTHGVARRYVRSHMRPSHEEFLAAVNVLIRLYMARFNDAFVETISIDHVAAQHPMRGVFVQVSANGSHVCNYGIIGGMPAMMRRPWASHPAEQIEQFQHALAEGVPPDSVELLSIRARSRLLRGDNRSAIAEASAALDLSVSRKIKAGLRKKGKSDQEVADLLRDKRNHSLEVRAKDLLHQATEKTAPMLDNTLWARVSEHRKTHRQGTTHSDAEPSGQEAQQVVNDFLQLARLVDEIILPTPAEELA
jgi:hypothetical protein